MNNRSVDLSALDPSRDVRRWQARIDAIVVETMRIRRQRPSLLGEAMHYARPALGVAAALALLSWAATLQRADRIAQSDATHPTLTLLRWASNDEVPATTEIFRSLEVDHGRP